MYCLALFVTGQFPKSPPSSVYHVAEEVVTYSCKTNRERYDFLKESYFGYPLKSKDKPKLP